MKIKLATAAPRISLAAVALLLASLLAFALPNYLVDDAYISLRYAQNLALGNGLTYNPGEQVEGYTNFLWVLLLAAAHHLGADLPAGARVAGFLAGLLTLLATGIVSTAVFPRRNLLSRLMPVLLLAASRPFWLWAVSGLETVLFSLLLTAGVALLMRDVGSRTGAGAALLFFASALTRPEGAMFFLLALTGWLLLAPSRARLRAGSVAAALFAGLLLVYLAWKWWYFGSLLPNTFYAKNIGRAELFRWGLAYLRSFLVDYGAGTGILAILAGFCVAPAGSERGRLRLLALLALVGTVYPVLAGGDIYYYNRFMVPILPLLFILVTAVALWCAERLGVRDQRRSSILAAVLLLVFAGSSTVLLEKRHFAAWREDRLKHRDREQIAAWLARDIPRETVIATIAAGYIPFATGMRNIDLAGLTNVEIGRAANRESGAPFTLAHEKTNAAYVLRRQPAFIEFRLFIAPVPAGANARAGYELDFAQFYEKFRRYPAHRELALQEEFHHRYRLMAYPLGAERIVATFQRFPAGQISGEEALANLGAACLAEGFFETGLQHLLSAARENPRSPLVRRRFQSGLAGVAPRAAASWENSFGVVLVETGAFTEAEDLFRSAVRRDPSNPVYRNNLAFVLIEDLGRPQEGLALAAALVDQSPRNPLFLDTYALGLYRSGKVKEALRALRQAAELDPANPEIQSHRALFEARK